MSGVIVGSNVILKLLVPNDVTAWNFSFSKTILADCNPYISNAFITTQDDNIIETQDLNLLITQ